MTVGERIKEIRNRLDMSQVAFADEINVSKQTLYKYENNIITNIPSDKIEAAARLGNVSPAYIMGWDYEFRDAPKSNLSKEDVESFKHFYDKSDLRKKRLENAIIAHMEKLNNAGKKMLLDYSEMLCNNPMFNPDLEVQAANSRTDIDVTQEMIDQDNKTMEDDSEWE